VLASDGGALLQRAAAVQSKARWRRGGRATRGAEGLQGVLNRGADGGRGRGCDMAGHINGQTPVVATITDRG
jgi:hypothetical protein